MGSQSLEGKNESNLVQVPGCIDTALARPLWIIIYIAHEQTARCITLTDQDLQRESTVKACIVSHIICDNFQSAIQQQFQCPPSPKINTLR